MRLTCPNCDAQYEVDDSAIPEKGRDVQCSNCGQTWFQTAAYTGQAGDTAPELQQAEQTKAPEPETIDAGPEAVVAAQEPPVPTSDTGETPDADASEADAPSAADDATKEDEPTEDAKASEPAKPEEAPQRQSLDAAVLDVLRQEAELETKARHSEGDGLETQPDLGLAEGDAAQDKAIRERTARLRGEQAAPDDTAHRRDLLPDIEEINSTLRAESDRAEGGEEGFYGDEDLPQRGGFRRGFALALLLFAIAFGVYIYAPALAQSWPGAEGALNGYVTWINGLRVWLDGAMNGTIEAISGLTEES